MIEMSMKISDVPLESIVNIEKRDALLVIDMQYDFLPGGALPVEEGDTIIPGINKLTDLFYEKERIIIFTQDWHPKKHGSFASEYSEKEPYDTFEAPGLGPVLWPDHCVQGTRGAEFASTLNTERGHLIVRKGYHSKIDSYSAFLENDQVTSTGLDGYLKGLDIQRIFLCGLALDYCVFYSAIDAKALGFDVVFILDLSRPVGAPEDSVSNALLKMVEEGIFFTIRENIQ